MGGEKVVSPKLPIVKKLDKSPADRKPAKRPSKTAPKPPPVPSKKAPRKPASASATGNRAKPWRVGDAPTLHKPSVKRPKPFATPAPLPGKPHKPSPKRPKPFAASATVTKKRKKASKKKSELPTTAERREVFYSTLSPEARAKLEVRASLSAKQARAKIARVVDRVADHYLALGLNCTYSTVQNSDQTVDGEVMVEVVDRMMQEGSQTQEARSLLNDIPAVLGKLDPEIWFSVRLHFGAQDPVDGDGDEAEGSMVYDLVTSSLLDSDYVLSEHRWKSLALQTAWQHGRNKLYSNIQGAVAIVTNTLRKNAEQAPVLTHFTYKMCWTPFNITPGKTR